MKLSTLLLRLISPEQEKERMEFRKAVAHSEAHSEDFHRTITMNRDEIEDSLRKCMNGHETR